MPTTKPMKNYMMPIVYKNCKAGCDKGIVYTRRFGMMYPIQCVYCLELAVQEKFPELKEVQRFTREELTNMLEDK